MILETPRAAESANAQPANTTPASQAINALGLDLLTKGAELRGNLLLSPYSIQAALAMTYAGADGNTKEQMAKVLHFGDEEKVVHTSFAALEQELTAAAKKTAESAEKAKKYGMVSDPLTLTVANRLFGQTGYAFRDPFLNLAKDVYGAPLQALDFSKDPSGARRRINSWVEEKTKARIRDLVPPDGIDKETRMVLVNAVYLKAPWSTPFPEPSTKPAPFYVPGGTAVQVPTMCRDGQFGYAKREGYAAITIPYTGNEVQFLILLPDERDGLADLERRLTPESLLECAQLKSARVVLYLPRFKVEPPLFRLGSTLQKLGMDSAFDKPRGSANFERMAPRRPDDYLYLSEVFHKTFLALDEKGTEAAAATAAVMARATSAILAAPDPVEVRVDHPFLCAIQHRPSGACLFLGRINDPR